MGKEDLEEKILVYEAEMNRLRRELSAALAVIPAYKKSIEEQRDYYVKRLKALGATDV